MEFSGMFRWWEQIQWLWYFSCAQITHPLLHPSLPLHLTPRLRQGTFSALKGLDIIHPEAALCAIKCTQNSSSLKDIQPWLRFLPRQLLTQIAGTVKQSCKSTDSSLPEPAGLSSSFKNSYAFLGQESKENTLWEEEMGIVAKPLIKNRWQELSIWIKFHVEKRRPLSSSLFPTHPLGDHGTSRGSLMADWTLDHFCRSNLYSTSWQSFVRCVYHGIDCRCLLQNQNRP